MEITYGNIRANARGLAQAMELGDDERWLCPLPLSHVGGLMVVLRSALMATTAVLGPPFERVGGAARRRITIASLVPTQLQRLLDAGADARAGRCAGSCSAAGRCRARCSPAPAPPASRSARATG